MCKLSRYLEGNVSRKADTCFRSRIREPSHSSGNIPEDQTWRMNTLMRANGTAWREQAFVQVQWGWIAAPVTLAILGGIFVVATIVQSSRQAGKYTVWKSSIVPTLLALSNELHGQIGGLRSLSENEDMMKHARASLRRNEERVWGLHGNLEG
jgi:hypothetical protein